MVTIAASMWCGEEGKRGELGRKEKRKWKRGKTFRGVGGGTISIPPRSRSPSCSRCPGSIYRTSLVVVLLLAAPGKFLVVVTKKARGGGDEREGGEKV